MMRETQKIQRVIFVFVLLAFLGAAQVARAEDVRVRTGSHRSYSRLVFDWNTHVEYTIERQAEDRLVVGFVRAATLDLSQAKANPVANIKALDVLSPDPLKVELAIPAQSRIRDLRAGNKVIIDIYNPSGAARAEPPPAKTAEKIPPEEKPAVEEKPAQTAAADAHEKQEKPDHAELHALDEKHETIKVDEAPTETAHTRQLKMREKPTLITVSSTQNFGMAAFELNDRLWLVNDKSNLLTKPQLSGPLADQLSEMDEVAIENGKVFVLPAPKARKMSGEGGGILWRIKIAANSEDKKVTAPVRAEVSRAEARSGKLLWPLNGARAVLDLEDPLTGRDIKIVTVDDARQYAGRAREFIDFEVLHAPIGLAIIPKVEDLEIKVVRGGVEISRRGGLTMVDETLLASMTSPKVSGHGDKKSLAHAAGPRIFDFKAWQLGGVETMSENKRIILGGLNDQPEAAQGENLLTLAKMYLSNAMGAEALGILEFALQERPGLSESPEFNALLGTSSALSRHNEEAYAYLSEAALEPFEEIKFWRALIFADVGDWQQAIETMPADISPLYDYPELLQNRIVPDLAEIVLRAGHPDTARELLHMIEKNEKP